jgi:ribosomal protein L11 methyltransferase
MKTWQVIDAVVNSDAREAAEYGLMEAGAIGTETTDKTNGAVSIAAYFDSTESIKTAHESVLEAFQIYGFDKTALLEFQTREIADQDWLAEWKKHWQPVEVGRFIIAPPWSEAPAPDDHLLVRINPGMAFGTGTHETTRLCLKAIDKYFTSGSFLDVGTGTGILAIAAAKLCQKPDPPGLSRGQPAWGGRQGGLPPITACDTDAATIAIAKENAELNHVSKHIDFSVGTIDEQTPSADLVCANLTAPVIVELLPVLLGVTCGRLILSGILETQFEMVDARLLEQAATVNEIMQDNEWLALVI